MTTNTQKTIQTILAAVLGGLFVLWIVKIFLTFIFEHWLPVTIVVVLAAVAGLFWLLKDDSTSV